MKNNSSTFRAALTVLAGMGTAFILPVYAEEDLSGYDYENDFQYMYQDLCYDVQCVTRAEDGYYFSLTDLLYYAPEDLSMVIPLCSRPECLHDGETTLVERAECDAFLGTNATVSPTVQYYGDDLYVLSSWDFNQKKPYWGMWEEYLYAISTDATERTELYECSGVIGGIALHRGNCYYARIANEEQTDGKVKQTLQLVRRPVMGGEEEILYEDEKFNSYGSMCVYQDYVYLAYWEEPNCISVVYEISTGEISYVEAEEGTRPMYAFEGDHMLLYYLALEEEQPVYLANLKGEKLEELPGFRLETGCLIHSDGQYLFVNNGCEEAVLSNEEPLLMRYYDRETLELLGEIDLGENMSFQDFTEGDERYLFYRRMSGDARQIWYLDKEELANGTAEEHFLLEGNTYDEVWNSDNESE